MLTDLHKESYVPYVGAMVGSCMATRVKNTYVFQYSANGRQRSLSLRTANPVQAQQRENKFRAILKTEGEQAARAYVIGRQSSTGAIDTIGRLIDLYGRYCAVSRSAPQAYTQKRNVEAMRQVAPNDMALDKLTTQYVNKWIEKCGKETNTVNSILRKAGSLLKKRALVYYLDNFGLELTNPFMAVEKEKPTIKEYQPLTDNDRRQMMQRAAQELATPSYGCFVLALFAGLRKEEVAEARVSWYADGRLFIKAEGNWQPKSGKGRTVPFKEEHKDLLVSDDTYLVAHNSNCKALRIEAPWVNLNKWLRENYSMSGHDLRRAYGSVVAQQTNDIFMTQRLLGHSTPMVTAAYYAGLINLPDIDFS